MRRVRNISKYICLVWPTHTNYTHTRIGYTQKTAWWSKTIRSIRAIRPHIVSAARARTAKNLNCSPARIYDGRCVYIVAGLFAINDYCRAAVFSRACVCGYYYMHADNSDPPQQVYAVPHTRANAQQTWWQRYTTWIYVYEYIDDRCRQRWWW